MNHLIQSDIKTMDSNQLRDLINECRLGVEQPIRLNKLNEKIVDELEGEHYTKSVVQNVNNTESTIYHLTVEQCTLIGMRESKAVRRSILIKLKQLEENQVPKTYAAALIEAGRLAQITQDQAEQLAIAAPKVAFVDQLVERDNLLTATQVGQKHKMSAIKLNRFLDELGGVYSKNVKRSRTFLQGFIDKGHGELKQNDSGHDQPLFTNKGEVWIGEQIHINYGRG